MERYLKPSETLCLDNKKFNIEEIIGKGSSCVVYYAKTEDNTEHLIKEYNPSDIEIYRNENKNLEVDNEDDKEKYDIGLKRFIKGGEIQRNLRLSTEHKNTICNVQAVYDAYGTSYIDMTCFAGKTYEKVTDDTLNNILVRAKALSQIIGNYHKAGLLHLDIKPENIFTIPETVDLVMLFDFDSVVEKSALPYRATISYTKSWAAPEQLLLGRQSKICEATDIFAIGEIIFYKLFGRHSSLEEKRSFAEYHYDFESEALKNVNPKVKTLLDELFHHTICSNVKKRYQSTEELAEKLDELITISEPKAQYIKTSLPEPEAFFIGRDREISEIGEYIKEHRKLFLSGVGGIGKSELAKQYAKNFLKSGRYDTVLFMPFVSDVMTMTVNDEAVPIYNFFRGTEEEIHNYYLRKMQKLKELCDDKTLIIIDNFDIDGVNDIDSEFKKITELGCDVLVTTRFDFTDTGYAQYLLDKIDDENDVLKIFKQYYAKPISEGEKEKVKEIISIVDSHTLAVELLAKQMIAGRVTPGKMLEKLQAGGIVKSGSESVLSDKDGDISRKNTYAHIKALFDISGLTDTEQSILANLSLIPYTGISAELFHDWCKLDSYEEINTLTTSGWIRCNREKDVISLHPVVGGICFQIITEGESKLQTFLESCLYEMKEIRYKDYPNCFCDRNIKSNIWFYIAKKLLSAEQNEKIISDFLGNEFWCDALDVDNYYTEIEKFYDKSITIKKQLNCLGAEDEITLCNNLCISYIYSCNYIKAEEFCKKTLELQKKLDKNNHLDLGVIYNNFGVIYSCLSRFDFAETNLLLSIKELNLADDNNDKIRNLANSYNHLGKVYLDKQKFEEAEKWFKNGIELLFKHSLESDTTVFYIYQALGNMYFYMERFNEAEEYYKKSLTMKIKMFGENSEYVTTSYIGIAQIYLQHKFELEQAKQYIMKSLEIREKIHGNRDTEVARCYNALAGYYDKIGDTENAEKYYKLALSSMIASLGDFDINVARLYKNLGALYLENNRMEEAEEALNKSLEIYNYQKDNTVGIEHIYYWLAQLYYKKSNIPIAYDYMNKSYEIYKNKFGADNSNTKKAKEFLKKLKIIK